MTAITPQYIETNLVGNLEQSIDATANAFDATMYDRISLVNRGPQSNTHLFVIDKGTEAFPNSKYEMIYADTSYDAVTGITSFTNVVRGLAFYGTSMAAGTGKEHQSQAEIGCADVHFLWTLLASCLDGTNSPVGFKLSSPPTFELAGIYADRVFANVAARDATITVPANGMSCYTIAENVFWDYGGGTWHDRANGATVNASETTNGTVQGSTLAQQNTATAVGYTGANLFIMNKNTVKISAGVADKWKVIITGDDGMIDESLLGKAIVKSIINAKGDWILGSANDTVGILTVGANGTIPIADSAQPLGVKWGATPLNSGNFNHGESSRVLLTASGNQTIAHGLGTTPVRIEIIAIQMNSGGAGSLSRSDGWWNGPGTEKAAWSMLDPQNGNNTYGISNFLIYLNMKNGGAGGKLQTAVINSVDATNFVLTWVLTGVPTGGDIVFLWKVYG